MKHMSLLALASMAMVAYAQPGWVLSHQKISDTEGGFTGILDNRDFFGSSVTSLGDRDGDGVGDLAVGATGDDDGGTSRGAVWVLFLNRDGTVKSHRKISDTQGGFTGILDDADWFGRSVASLGDLDGDGVGGLDAGVLCGHPISFSDFFLSARERSACTPLLAEVKFTSGREARVRPAKAGRGLFQAGVMASSV